MRDRKYYDDAEDLCRKWTLREQYNADQARIKKSMDEPRHGKGVQNKKVEDKKSQDKDKDCRHKKDETKDKN